MIFFRNKFLCIPIKDIKLVVHVADTMFSRELQADTIYVDEDSDIMDTMSSRELQADTFYVNEDSDTIYETYEIDNTKQPSCERKTVIGCFPN